MLDVLQLDVSGRPQAWISAREAAVIYACDGVAWTLGPARAVLRGGIQRVTGRQSRIAARAFDAPHADSCAATIGFELRETLVIQNDGVCTFVVSHSRVDSSAPSDAHTTK